MWGAVPGRITLSVSAGTRWVRSVPELTLGVIVKHPGMCDPINMVIKPTYDDVNLILRLYEQRREDKMRTAREWFAQSFKYHTMEGFNRGCPVGSSMNAYARMVLSYWEMAASFVTSGVLHQELFFQSGGELLFVWVRVRELVPHMREA